MFVCDKRDRAITCMLCRDLHLALMFSCFYKKICLKESDVWRKVISNKIVVTVVTQGLPSSFLSGPGARFSKGPVTFRARNQIFKYK